MMAPQNRACSATLACAKRAARLTSRPMMSGRAIESMNRLVAVTASSVTKSSAIGGIGVVAWPPRRPAYWKATSAKLRSLRLCRRLTPPARRISMARMPMRRCWSTRSR